MSGLLPMLVGLWLLAVAVLALLLAAVSLLLGWPGHVLEMSGAIGVAGGVLVGLAWWGADHG